MTHEWLRESEQIASQVTKQPIVLSILYRMRPTAAIICLAEISADNFSRGKSASDEKKQRSEILNGVDTGKIQAGDIALQFFIQKGISVNASQPLRQISLRQDGQLFYIDLETGGQNDLIGINVLPVVQADSQIAVSQHLAIGHRRI
jgi:hypothetical protein